MSNATLITRRETTTTIGQKLDQLQSSLETHVASTHGEVHLGLQVTQPVALYKDSVGQTWGDRVGVIEIDGVKYYFPAKIA